MTKSLEEKVKELEDKVWKLGSYENKVNDLIRERYRILDRITDLEHPQKRSYLQRLRRKLWRWLIEEWGK